MPGAVADDFDALRWVDDRQSGIRRIATPGRDAPFSYRDAAGRGVRDAAVLARIRALAIPPAWTDVWICADPRGHLQATGRDARGRKQYRYHPAWLVGRGRFKFDGLRRFGSVLPRIRARVQRTLAGGTEPTRERVLAMPACGDELQLSFTGKAGVRHCVRLTVLALQLTLAACAENAQSCRPQALLAAVARRLGNGAAVCRKAYIHPRVLALSSTLGDAVARAQLRGARWTQPAARGRGLSLAERQLMALLRVRTYPG